MPARCSECWLAAYHYTPSSMPRRSASSSPPPASSRSPGTTQGPALSPEPSDRIPTAAAGPTTACGSGGLLAAPPDQPSSFALRDCRSSSIDLHATIRDFGYGGSLDSSKMREQRTVRQGDGERVRHADTAPLTTND